MYRVLLIASNEICYNPRLIKAADFFLAKGCEVTVFNPVLGIADAGLYKSFKSGRAWTIEEFDISKRSLASKFNWLWATAISAISKELWRKLGYKKGFNYIMSKGSIGYSLKSSRFDVIVVNLVNNLPFAASLKKKDRAFLIYDSQEFFSGQYANASEAEKRWVTEAESRFINRADLILTTTNVMRTQLTGLYDLRNPPLRVRNAPFRRSLHEQRLSRNGREKPLQLVWHGFQVSYKGRGINLLIDALAQYHASVRLTLQGRLTSDQTEMIANAAQQLGIRSLVGFREAAHPELIVESIRGYDVGLIAETGLDENQLLTSSNKLFDYMHAGLAVVAPDLPGLSETIKECNNGLLYESGSAFELSKCIERLATDVSLLRTLQENSLKAAAQITWENDYSAVWRELSERLNREGSPFN